MADVAEHGWLQRALWVALERAPQSAEGLIHRVHAGVVAPAANFRLPLVRLQGSARGGGPGSLLLAARGRARPRWRADSSSRCRIAQSSAASPCRVCGAPC